MYSPSGGSLGFLIASHCRDPGDWQKLVFQPYFNWFANDNNYAGYTVDNGTNDAYEELNKTKPDATVWWVLNRGVSYWVPTSMCGWRESWSKVIGYFKDEELENSTGAWKIGFSTGCTGSDNALVKKTQSNYYSGKVFMVEYNELKAEPGDSGGLVFRAGCNGGECGVLAMGIIIGAIPPGGPYYYTLFQSVENATNYYGVVVYDR
ncbi:hypothetical protein Pogu_0941 [Pyrobaculum oguniense TE7]|uniref:Trypsin n=1 Tax=Pyrobaculum oguniense (strain DSM 13380 / JCM 10595 / TE7) TaxID=698757 RepID=H6Q8G1_PYROT|nr:hypothetical protein Pogu_0941 [Pyrobaculum oguniense TE7]